MRFRLTWQNAALRSLALLVSVTSTVGLLPCSQAADPEQKLSVEGAPWPRASGSCFAYRNSAIGAPVLAFDTQGRELLTFEFQPLGRALFGRDYELVCQGGRLIAKDAGTWIGAQIAKSGEFTVEALITLDTDLPKTNGVLLAYADERGEDLALIQGQAGLAVRWAGNTTSELFASPASQPTHVLVACGKQKWLAYRDGRPMGEGKHAAGLPAWGQRQLLVGAAYSGADPWRGRVESIALFPRALSAEEAARESAAARAVLKERKPPTRIRFRGTLLRQATTSKLSEIRPYTRSMTLAEYRVDKVLSGQWKEPKILVLHWMILDNQRLPLADRQPGVQVELTVEPLGEHPQLESCRRNDELDDTLELDKFYCESES